MYRLRRTAAVPRSGSPHFTARAARIPARGRFFITKV